MTTYKQPSEKIPIEIDFSGALPQGETIENTSTVVVKDADGNDVTNTMLSAQAVNGSDFGAVIIGGVDLTDYKVTFIAVTSPGGYRLEQDVLLKVREQ